MTLNEMKAALEWGLETIKQMKAEGEKIPTFMYERILELSDKIAKLEA